jgi:ADP-ribose pyrophosphatase YjhB (NUDIX family)
MHRHQLLTLLRDYRTRFMDEAAMVARTRLFVLAHEHCFDRGLRHGHVSGSAWVVNPARSHVFLLHHRKVKLWLQPGGHADNNHDIIDVALNETAEESGADRAAVRLLSRAIFDLDVHLVHETATEPRHWHYDIRFLVELGDRLYLPGTRPPWTGRPPGHARSTGTKVPTFAE